MCLIAQHILPYTSEMAKTPLLAHGRTRRSQPRSPARWAWDPLACALAPRDWRASTGGFRLQRRGGSFRLCTWHFRLQRRGGSFVCLWGCYKPQRIGSSY
jgi:hypothetical protein